MRHSKTVSAKQPVYLASADKLKMVNTGVLLNKDESEYRIHTLIM